ncbi:MAG: DUF3793 family protein [Ruminococcus sp.]|nr:DUF3793 family protein [Ruminococcus sp.]
MSEEMIVKNCSPTLAGLKTASMFSCSFGDKSEMVKALCSFNRLLSKKGVRAVPLRYRNGKALIYIYRPKKLSFDLTDDTAHRVLSERGYDVSSPQRCIVELVKRLNRKDDFPHEIGLFLGYPPLDVVGFIENRKDELKCTGYFKVYSDKEKAEKLFAQYKKCTDVYSALVKKGRGIERLTVAS